MRRVRLPLIIVAGLLAAGLGACGSPPRNEGLRGLLGAAPDSLDPALADSQSAWVLLSTVYTPLLTYRRKEGAAGARLVPGLAQALPSVTDHGRLYRLRLRRGLRYSDGTALRAGDFEHAIKRVLTLDSPGSVFFEDIVGADAYRARHDPDADISGVSDDGARTISIRLREADATFANHLALIFSAPVPSTTAMRNLSASPPPGIGPFSIGKPDVNRRIVLRRNPRYPRIPGLPPARVGQITMDVVGNAEQRAVLVLRNEADFLVDPPTGHGLAAARATGPRRYAEFTTPSTYYLFLNVRAPPFDDVRVRRAANDALDKRALSRLFGGLLAPGCDFIPPGVVAHSSACPYGAPTSAPNLEAARRLVRAAGARGAAVTVWGDDSQPDAAVTDYLASALSAIGLRARPRILAAPVYFQTVGNRATHAQAGFANWFPDFPHPADFFVPVDGRNIAPTASTNLGNTDDPDIQRLLRRAAPLPLAQAAVLYARADRLLLARAYVAPYGTRRLVKFVSDRVDIDSLRSSPVYGLDLTGVALR